MGKHLSNYERACILSKEILEDFNKGAKLSVLLKRSASLARLMEDKRNQMWIDKEILGSFNPQDKGDLVDISLNGRYWTQNQKPIYRLEQVNVLERLIESEKVHLAASQDPNISYTPKSPYDMYHPHGNNFERSQIIESIKRMEMILAKIEGRLYKFVLDSYHILNFSEIVTDIFSSIKKDVDLRLRTYAPDILNQLTVAFESANSSNQEKWSNVASGCRRILITIADKVFPPTNEEFERKTAVSSIKINLNAENYRYRILKYIKGQEREDVLARDTSEYLFELLDSVDRMNAKGDKHQIKKSTAEKILIYTYLLLSEVLRRTAYQRSETDKETQKELDPGSSPRMTRNKQ